MTRAVFLAATSVVAIVTTAASADAVRCGETYTVQRGDHLSDIAKQAYGRSENYGLICAANADVISAIRRIETTEALPAPAETRPIRVLTATDWALNS